jgi:hypothetical protein
MRWYISAAAVKQYMAICGYEGRPDGPVFDAAAIELENLCEQAKLARDVGPGQQSQLWRVKATVRGKRTRLELVVSVEPRPEGLLPQLVAVRNKGA